MEDMENLNINELNPNVELITGKPKETSMLSGLDVDLHLGAFFYGLSCHGRLVLKGVSAHTFSTAFNQVKLDE
ncbi:MAG: M55 family metallopeptidase [Bacillus subtilis]|nr:M55 family metallopeptidase [Bacillus subtilis]